MSITGEESKKILKDLFDSPRIPWDRVKIVRVNWKRMNVGSDQIRDGHLGFWRKFVVVPMIEIVMK